MRGKIRFYNMKKKIIFTFAMFTAVCVLPVVHSRADSAETQNQSAGMVIKDNIYVDGVPIGGMTVEEAIAEYSLKSDELSNVDVVIESEYGNVNTKLSKLDYSDDSKDIITEASELGNKGNILKRYYETRSLETEPAEYTVSKCIAAEAVDEVIKEQLGDVLDAKTGKPRLIISGGEISVVPESEGIFVDNEKLAQNINDIISGNWNGTSITVSLVIDENGVDERVEQLKEIKNILGEFTTDYSSASGRMKNVERATELLNGTVLYPGEQLSVYDTISPIDASNGYYSGGQYVGGMLVEGVGGGVCQVSTTLYNALIRAELEIVQRNNHGLTVSYVPLSADAALAGGVLDLKFKNNTDAPIYIEGFCTDGEVTFKVYGKEYRPDNRTIEFESKTISVISPGPDEITEDPTLEPGTTKITQKARTGYNAELWKYVYVDGVLTESVLVNTSTYKATPNYVSVGPAATEQPADVPSTEAPVTDVPSTEAPVPEIPTETPSTEAPVPEIPTEAPSTEAPVPEIPTEAPSTEAPSTEAPSTEAPVTETPSTEQPTSGETFIL